VLACGLLFLGSLLLYAKAVGFDFVNFDDERILLGHPNLYDEHSLLASLFEIFIGYFPREEPLLLRDVSWALDARVFGFANPAGYHLGNVLLNAANGCLLFLFLGRTTRAFGMSLGIAAIFCVLPIHAEPVSWVMGRKDLLSSFFVLLALLTQSHELSSTAPARRRTLYLLTILFTLMALLSKTGAVSLFIVLGLHRAFHPYLDGSRAPDARMDLVATLRGSAVRIAPHALVTLGVVIWYARIIRGYGVMGRSGPGPTDPEHLANVVLFAPLSIAQYLKQVFWNSQASIYYRWPHVEIPLSTREVVSSLLILAAITGATLYCCLRRKDLAFYLLSFLAFLLPYLNLIYVGIWRADRYVYLSSFCLLSLVALLLRSLHARSGLGIRYAIVASAVSFALISAFGAYQRQDAWRSNEELWRYEVQRDEPSLLSIQALATHLMKQAEQETDAERRSQRIAESREQVQRGIAREKELGRVPAPYRTSEQLQLARFHYLLGRLGKLEGVPMPTQIAHFETAHELAPTRATSLMLAGAYFEFATAPPIDQHEERMHRSLDYFLEYVAYSRADPIQHESSLVLLAQNYGPRFPFLHERTLAAQGTARP
jgi:hypothetical protein